MLQNSKGIGTVDLLNKNFASQVSKATGLKVFDLVQNVSGYLEGDISDWPANIQNQIYEALETKARQVMLPLHIIHSYCGIEPSEAPGGRDTFYAHVIASEIVVVDEGVMAREKAQLAQIIKNIKGGN